MKKLLVALCVMVLGGAWANPASAKTTDVAAAADAVVIAPPAPVANAMRIARAPTIDGNLTDSMWASAPKNGGFVRRFPNPNLPALRTTEFAVLYDDVAIYIGVWATDESPTQIRGLLTRRDQDSVSDVIGVSFDSYHDRRTAFTFSLNPAGVQRDMLIFDDSNSDDSWDAVWTGGTARTATGWTAEFRIPLSQLRFSASAEQTWGMQVIRNIARTGEEDVWSPWQRSDAQIVSKFGTLRGIRNVKPGRRLELLPYVSGGLQKMPVEANDPLNDSLSLRRAIGIDAKYGLSSAFTLSATLNPDFGQVEADPSQVNLSAHELYFAERRPFFLEGTELFQMGVGSDDGTSESLFYSRRIGGAPHGSVDGLYTKIPTATAIYGAAKISGKTESGWSVGALNVVTGQERGTSLDADANQTTAVVEPLTNFSLARIKRDFREGKSTVGMMATGVQRALAGTQLHDQLVAQAYTGGVDGLHRWGYNGGYQFKANLYGSIVHGSSDAVAGLQRLARHNFQRPDAPHLSYNPMRTTMAGAALGWRLASINADPHWRYGLGGDIRTPEFEANDMGFQTSADQVVTYGFASYRDDAPGGGLLSYQLNTNLWTYTDFEPRLAGWGGNFNGNVTTTDMWNIGGGINYDINRWDFTALRGGAALRANSGLSGWGFFNTDSRHRVQVGGSANAGLIPGSDTWSSSGDLSAQIQARSNLEISLGPSVSVMEDDRQFVEQTVDTTGITHYVVGRIRQVTAAMTLRLAWTLTPNVGFQLYAQPFLSTGSYSDYKDADRPAAQAYADRFYHYATDDLRIDGDQIAVGRDRSGPNAYTFARPDYGARELRSTLVVRWQYGPGSTIFAIWSHGRSAFDGDGAFRLGSELNTLANTAGENVVMLKANYWFGL